MKRYFPLATLGFVLALAIVAPGALAHRATERYIPIGRSPGASGEVTVIGYVSSMSESSHEFWVTPASDWEAGDGPEDSGGESADVPVHCTDRTDFWLDRSSLELTNLRGSLEDCEVGTLVEVRFYEDDAQDGTAWWVKIRVDEAP